MFDIGMKFFYLFRALYLFILFPALSIQIDFFVRALLRCHDGVVRIGCVLFSGLLGYESL